MRSVRDLPYAHAPPRRTGPQAIHMSVELHCIQVTLVGAATVRGGMTPFSVCNIIIVYEGKMLSLT